LSAPSLELTLRFAQGRLRRLDFAPGEVVESLTIHQVEWWL